MKKQDMIDILERVIGSIQQHHATNLCDSHYLFKQSRDMLEVVWHLKAELALEKGYVETCWIEAPEHKYCGVASGYSDHKNCPYYKDGMCHLLDKEEGGDDENKN